MYCGSTPATRSRKSVRETQPASRISASTAAMARATPGMGTPSASVQALADLDPGHHRVGSPSPPDRVAVAEHVLAVQRHPVQRRAVAPQAGDPPLAAGEAELRMHP